MDYTGHKANSLARLDHRGYQCRPAQLALLQRVSPLRLPLLKFYPEPAEPRDLHLKRVFIPFMLRVWESKIINY